MDLPLASAQKSRNSSANPIWAVTRHEADDTRYREEFVAQRMEGSRFREVSAASNCLFNGNLFRF
jgi:hypothetical protein